MTVVIKSENIGGLYICLECYPTTSGTVYRATLNEDRGGYYSTTKSYISPERKKAAAAYSRYRREANNGR